MKKLHFSGHSDDVVILVDDANSSEEYEVWDKAFTASITDRKGQSLVVYGKYGIGGAGIWMFGICQFDCDRDIPNWPVSFETAENGYSVVLTIEVPDNVKICTGD